MSSYTVAQGSCRPQVSNTRDLKTSSIISDFTAGYECMQHFLCSSVQPATTEGRHSNSGSRLLLLQVQPPNSCQDWYCAALTAQ